MTVFASAGKARTFDYQAGDVGYVPFAMGHYVENTGDEPLRFLEMFRSDHFADVSLNQWMALTPPRARPAAPQPRRPDHGRHRPGADQAHHREVTDADSLCHHDAPPPQPASRLLGPLERPRASAVAALSRPTPPPAQRFARAGPTPS